MGYRVLSIDQASLTGWCLMENGVPKQYGVLDFTKIKDKVERHSQIKKGINFLIKATKCEVISIEDIQQQINPQTFKTLAELKGVVENLIYEKEFLYFVVSPSEWRSGIGIKGRKREEIKTNAIQFIRDNYDIELDNDSDCAEAICMATYITLKILPKIEIKIDKSLFE